MVCVVPCIQNAKTGCVCVCVGGDRIANILAGCACVTGDRILSVQLDGWVSLGAGSQVSGCVCVSVAGDQIPSVRHAGKHSTTEPNLLPLYLVVVWR